MTPDFWLGKTVLLTGHTGFKGAWLSLWLKSVGANVIGFSLDRPSQPCLYDLAGVSVDVHDIKGDIRQFDALSATVAQHAPDIVIHMAAQSLVRRSYREPLQTYATNVMGTANLLEAVRANPGARVMLVVTSDKCYQNQDPDAAFNEADPMGGHDPYSSSKGCAELVTAAWRQSFFSEHTGLGVASARAGNVIGGGDFAEDRIIPDIVNAFQAGRKVELRNPDATRPWQFVLEPLNGYLNLAEHLWSDPAAFASGWNFGPSEEDVRPVAWLTNALAARWGERAGWECDGTEHPYESTRLTLDCSKAQRLLAWRPALTLDETLDWVIEWYRTYFAGGDLRTVSLQQIERFQAKVRHV